MRPSLPVCRKAEISVAYQLFSQSTSKQQICPKKAQATWKQAHWVQRQLSVLTVTASHDVGMSITPSRSCSSILCNMSIIPPHVGWWQWLRGAKDMRQGGMWQLAHFQVKKEISGGCYGTVGRCRAVRLGAGWRGRAAI